MCIVPYKCRFHGNSLVFAEPFGDSVLGVGLRIKLSKVFGAYRDYLILIVETGSFWVHPTRMKWSFWEMLIAQNESPRRFIR